MIVVAWALVGARPGGTSLARPSEENSVRTLIQAGEYGDAVRRAREALENVRQREPASLATSQAIDQLVEALCLNGEAAAPATLAQAEEALRDKTHLLGPADPRLADSLINLGTVLIGRGEYAAALTKYRAAVALREQDRAGSPAGLAEALERLGHMLRVMERNGDARQVLARAVALRRAQAVPDRLALAGALEELAAATLRSGSIKETRPLIDEAMAIRSAQSAEHPVFAATLNGLGDFLWFDGHVAEARTAYSRALALARARLQPQHPLIALSLRNLGEMVLVHESPERGRILLDEARVIAIQAYGADHPEVAWVLSDLGWASRMQGDYIDARHFYEKALGIFGRRLGSRDPHTATILNNLAILHQQIGDLDRAIALQQQAMSIWRNYHKPRETYLTNALNTLANMLADAGRLVPARRAFKEVLAIRVRASNDDDTAHTLSSLSSVMLRLGQPAQARRYAERAVTLLTAPDRGSRAGLWEALEARAEVRQHLGNWAGARADHEQARMTLEEKVGRSNPLLTRLHADLAVTLAKLGEANQAVDLAVEAEEAGRTHLRLTSEDLSERLALGYAATRPRGLDLALSVVTGGGTGANTTDRVFDQLIQSRAVVLDEMARRSRVVKADPETTALREALAKARQRYANLLVRGPESQTRAQYEAMVDQAREHKEAAERALAERSVQFKTDLAQTHIGLTDVRAALPADTVLVSFIAFDDRLAARPHRVYVACVMRAGSPVRIVSLGSAATIDPLVSAWRREMVAVAPSRTAGEMLRRRVWDPVSPYIEGARRLFIVPDGALNIVSFAALPVGRTGYVIERSPILHYLSAERDVVRGDRDDARGRGLLAIGDPAFNLNPGLERASAGTRTRSACGTLQTMRFEPLPGARTEATAIARLWSSRAGNASEGDDDARATVLSGVAATERAFKTQAPAQRILHLATHGFFLGGTCESGPAPSRRSVGGLAPARAEASAVPNVTNPLILSGLALAGANQRARARADDDDGVLTAEEVAGLDLSGVEWAVLSACDTGVGEVKTGEGVFGLRRALHVAGAHTVIMSLWAVEDRATLDWMRALYEGRFTNALDTATAVHDASLAVLHQRRDKGQSTHPFFWAGFVAVGDWR